ncbi:alpha/beta fold hydrolase [Ralstonia pseudosolanacearum]|uniref:alpha/beta fold hydrolase n=1 Tax=Ralstonia pseudosolanacearum TaxID=1310165 RepID=UPI0018D1C472|nr:alpha/beta hydrolase [Ralstonia pseudosolanacearum]
MTDVTASAPALLPGPDHSTLRAQRIDGDPARPTLVFLHEGLGCIEMWGSYPQRLCAATGCPGLVYDRVGYGQSSPMTRPRGLDYLHLAACIELPHVLQALMPDTPYVLIGHSDGGSIALIHAADRPAQLRAVVTEAAHVFVEDASLAGIREADAAFDAGKLAGLARYHGDKTTQTFKAWSETWQSADFRDWSIEALLPRIACPLLVMQGEDDQYGTPAQVEAIVRQAGGPASPVLLPGCGHTPHRTHADAVLGHMRAFIEALRLTA